MKKENNEPSKNQNIPQQLIENTPRAEEVAPSNATPISEDEDDNVASAEEMAAFIKDRRSKTEHRKAKEEERDVFGEFSAPESSIDPYLEPDPKLPWVKHTDNPFLSRGCKKCPQPYESISETEMNICSKVTTHDWMKGIRQSCEIPFDIVEVRFKNNHKDFFRIPEGISVTTGDVVAVEGQPGHDVGIVTLTGEICRLQMRKKKVSEDDVNIRKLFRRAKSSDIERWVECIKDEHRAMLKTRQIATDLGLEMKVNDVEFQGDHAKATFYYTADDRVDFRSLIKVLADEFHVRIEMKQIGVRQEAGKVGGIGTCGREICCSTWLTNFKSVTTNAAKVQQILPNPQKLAGQCGKLKCCLNFEYEVYVDALKKFPPANTPIRFQKGLALYKKTDVFRGVMWYCYEGENDLYAIPAESVKKVIEMNRNQEYPERLEDFQVELMSTSALAQESTNAEFEKELMRLADNSVADSDGEVYEQRTERPSRREDRPNRERRDSAKAGGREGHRHGNNGGGQRTQQQGGKPRKDNAGEHHGDRPKGQERHGNRNHPNNEENKENK